MWARLTLPSKTPALRFSVWRLHYAKISQDMQVPSAPMSPVAGRFHPPSGYLTKAPAGNSIATNETYKVFTF